MVGIDIVDVERFRATLLRSPRMEDRVFTPAERAYCRDGSDPAVHFAGTVAAKEAVIKALGLGPLAAWARRIEIVRGPSGAPHARVRTEPDPGPIHISITHDAGVAAAVALHLGNGPATQDPLRRASRA